MSEHEGRAPAPGGLRLVEDFVNSLDYPDGDDQLATCEQAAAWLSAHGLSGGSTLSRADCTRLREVRERLRDLLEAHTGKDVPAAVTTELRRALASTPLTAELRDDGVGLTPGRGGVDELLGRIAAAMVEATLAGTWKRLKVCAADTCRFAFYDHSKNGSGAWCTMRVCGSRAKARAYRQRRRQPATA